MKVINKISLTVGAKFDYTDIVCMMPINESKFIENVTKLVDKLGVPDRIDSEIVYDDPDSGLQLMLFITQNSCICSNNEITYEWLVVGICTTDSYESIKNGDGSFDWMEVNIDE